MHHLGAGDRCPWCGHTIAAADLTHPQAAGRVEATPSASPAKIAEPTPAPTPHPSPVLGHHTPSGMGLPGNTSGSALHSLVVAGAPQGVGIRAASSPAATSASGFDSRRADSAMSSGSTPDLSGAGNGLPTTEVAPRTVLPAARLTDPDTSYLAASMPRATRLVYLAIVEALVEHGPLTDHDLARYVSAKLERSVGQTSVGVRRGELRDQYGWVQDSGHKGTTPTGAKAIRWGLTDLGRQQAGVAA